MWQLHYHFLPVRCVRMLTDFIIEYRLDFRMLNNLSEIIKIIYYFLTFGEVKIYFKTLAVSLSGIRQKGKKLK